MLSDYCKTFSDKYGIKVDDVKKLVPNLGDTTNYVLHYRNLQLHLFFGMKLTKIHKVLKFKQSDWMRKLKLMINSVYGKAMENLRKRINVRLVNNKKFLKNIPPNQTILLIKPLMKIMLLFMKLNQF